MPPLVVPILFIVATWLTDGVAADRKLIYYGWHNPTAGYAATHSREMEATAFDGTAIVLPIDRAAWDRGLRDTSNQLGWALFGARRFTTADFANEIAQLGATMWERFTDNFLPAIVNSRAQGAGFSWFDDARWDTIVRNWIVLLKIARRAGCRGIILDPEDYGGHIFHHGEMAQRHPGDFAAYQRIVRARGRQLMQAGQQVFPGLVVLGLFGPSLPMDIDDDQLLADSPYGLYSAFVDGLVAGADPAFRFIDGGEFAYGYRTSGEFLKLRKAMTDRIAQRSVLAPDQRRAIEIGFGLWIDNGGRRKWSADDASMNYFTPSGLRTALENAFRASDRYVWIYSEAVSFFPPTALPPDYLDAIVRARATP